MKFVVVLYADSLIGRSFLSTADSEHEGHPLLDCTAVEQGPAFLHLKRAPKAAGRRGQSLWVRYTDVVLVAEYAADEPRPFGFGAASPTGR